MKTLTFSFLIYFLLSALFVNAQNEDKGKYSYAIIGGLNMQALNGKNPDGTNLDNRLKPGYLVGVNVSIPIVPMFFFQPGLLYITKGANHVAEQSTSKYTLSYVEMPLNVVYKSLLGNGYVMIGFGPYISYGVGGKVLTKSGSETVETAVEFRNVVMIGDPLFVNYFRPIDAGGNAFAGYEMASGIFCQLHTQLGMLKINPEDRRIRNDQSSIKNAGFGISTGYRF